MNTNRFVITIVVDSPAQSFVDDYISDMKNDLRCVDNLEAVSIDVSPE